MTDSHRIEHFPIAFFAMIMGLSGLSLAWQKAAEVLHTPAVVGTALVLATAGIFLVLVGIYLTKLVRFPAAVAAELRHPVKMSFFPAISISLVLLGTALRGLSPDLAYGLWIAGASAHLLVTLYIVTQWMHQAHFEITHINPTWFIPAVGNILVPIAGVGFGHATLSWFFFSIGILFWLVLLTIVFYRVFFHAPLPGRLLPTLFIMVAPPAAGFVAYIQLAGSLDGFARILVNIGLFLTLLLLVQARRFASLQFFLSFWAYSFPMAAMTIATLIHHELTGSDVFLWLGAVLLGLTTVLISWLIGLTIRAAANGQICQPEG
ncbi:MAG: SLAC1 anion channel family protein [Spiribacter sp.]|nr:SLAC1 anion channel family protein [Spiribacter sp.]